MQIVPGIKKGFGIHKVCNKRCIATEVVLSYISIYINTTIRIYSYKHITIIGMGKVNLFGNGAVPASLCHTTFGVWGVSPTEK